MARKRQVARRLPRVTGNTENRRFGFLEQLSISLGGQGRDAVDVTDLRSDAAMTTVIRENLVLFCAAKVPEISGSAETVDRRL